MGCKFNPTPYRVLLKVYATEYTDSFDGQEVAQLEVGNTLGLPKDVVAKTMRDADLPDGTYIVVQTGREACRAAGWEEGWAHLVELNTPPVKQEVKVGKQLR